MIPFVSIVMPVRNEKAFIEISLNKIANQDYPKNRMEVIVADGMSGDGTREIIDSFKKRFSFIKIINNPGRIVSTGLNAAIQRSGGEIIIRVDGHCQIASDYVRQCVRYLKKDGVDCVGGTIKTVGDSYISQTIAIAMSSQFGVGGAPFRMLKNHAMFVDTVAFGAYTRAAIKKNWII